MTTLIAALINAALQLADLWTTSEVLRLKLGHEDNPRMVEVVKDPAKFRRVKVAMALAMFAFPLGAWLAPQVSGLMLFVAVSLAIWYTPIVWSNWRILKNG